MRQRLSGRTASEHIFFLVSRHPVDELNKKLESVSIGESLHNRQHAVGLLTPLIQRRKRGEERVEGERGG